MHGSRQLIKSLSLSLVLVVFITHVVFAYAPEVNFWKQRMSLRGSPDPRQSIIVDSGERLPRRVAPRNDDVIIPQQFGTIRQISKGNSDKTIIHIQDVHLNTEAQENIAGAIQSLIDAGQVDLIALEGAFAPIDLSQLREFPHQDSVHKVADYLFRENKISGPILTAFKSKKEIPVIVGVDDKHHYDLNVEAVKESFSLKEKLKAQNLKLKINLNEQKAKVFNQELLEFDHQVEAYRNEKLSMGEYATLLSRDPGNTQSSSRNVLVRDPDRPHDSKNQVYTLDPGLRRGDDNPTVIPAYTVTAVHATVIPAKAGIQLSLFIEAYNLEQSLNFSKVEHERAILIKKLLAQLTSQATKQLLTMSNAFKSGNLNHADFYSYLQKLCEKNNIPLKNYPAMRDYLQYILLSDSIDGEKLQEEFGNKEKEIYDHLAKTEEEKELIQISRQNYLEAKLLDFALTKQEWEEHVSLRGTPVTKQSKIAAGPSGPRNDIVPFERFYEHAELRDQKMAQNLQAAIEKYKAKNVVLVTGGFHSEGIKKGLVQSTGYRGSGKKLINSKNTVLSTQYALRNTQSAVPSLISFIPKISKVDSSQGSAYLSLFTQQKTPLDQLFEGEKLFLALKPMVATESFYKSMILHLQKGPEVSYRFGREIWQMVKDTSSGVIENIKVRTVLPKFGVISLMLYVTFKGMNLEDLPQNIYQMIMGGVLVGITFAQKMRRIQFSKSEEEITDEDYETEFKRLSEYAREEFYFKYGRLADDHPLTTYVRDLFRYSYGPEADDYDVIIIPEWNEVNAVALPDYTILISAGLLKTIEYEEELIAVLAHEALHIKRRHAEIRKKIIDKIYKHEKKKISDLILMLIGISRAQEYEADLRWILNQMTEKKINPYGQVIFLERIQALEERESYHQDDITHGSTEDRSLNTDSLFYLLPLDALTKELTPVDEALIKQLPSTDEFERLHFHHSTFPTRFGTTNVSNKIKEEKKAARIKIEEKRLDWAENMPAEYLPFAYKRMVEKPIGSDSLARKYDRDILKTLLGGVRQEIFPKDKWPDPIKRQLARIIYFELYVGIPYLKKGPLNLKGIAEKDMALFENPSNFHVLLEVLESSELQSIPTFKIGNRPFDFANQILNFYVENHNFLNENDSEKTNELLSYLERLSTALETLYSKKGTRLYSSGEIFTHLVNKLISMISDENRSIRKEIKKMALNHHLFKELDANIRNQIDSEYAAKIAESIYNRSKRGKAYKFTDFTDIHEYIKAATEGYDIYDLFDLFRTITFAILVPVYNKYESIGPRHSGIEVDQLELKTRVAKYYAFRLFLTQLKEHPDHKRLNNYEINLIELLALEQILAENIPPLYNIYLKLKAGPRGDLIIDPMSIDPDKKFFTAKDERRNQVSVYNEEDADYLRKNYFYSVEENWINNTLSREEIVNLHQLMTESKLEDSKNKRFSKKSDFLTLLYIVILAKYLGQKNSWEAIFNEFDALEENGVPVTRYLSEYGTEFSHIFSVLWSTLPKNPTRAELEQINKSVGFVDDPFLRTQLQSYYYGVMWPQLNFEEKLDALFSKVSQGVFDYKRFNDFIEEEVETKRQADVVLERVEDEIDIFLNSSSKEAGVAAFLSVLSLDGQTSQDLLLALLESGQDDEKLKRVIYKNLNYNWKSLNATNVEDDQGKNEHGEIIHRHRISLKISVAERVTGMLLRMGDFSKNILLRKLLTGRNGLISKPKHRKEFLNKLVNSAIERGQEQELLELIRNVIEALAGTPTWKPVYFALQSVLVGRIGQPPEFSTSWSIIEPEAPKGEIDSLEKLMEDFGENSKKPWVHGRYFSNLSRAILRKNLENRGVISSPKKLEQFTPLSFILGIIQKTGALGVRFLQVLPQFVEIKEEYLDQFTRVYDAMIGQSKLVARSFLEDKWPKMWSEVSKIGKRVGGGSLMTVYKLHMKNGETRVVKVINPNLKFHLETVVQLAEDILDFLVEKFGSKYAVARLVIEEVQEWIRRDISFKGFLEKDARFKKNNHGFTAQGLDYEIYVPQSYEPNSEHFMVEEYVEGDNLTKWKKLEKDGHDMKAVVSLLAQNYIKQLGDNLIHSDVHIGNFRVFDKKVAILDRNLFLELDEKTNNVIKPMAHLLDMMSTTSEDFIDKMIKASKSKISAKKRREIIASWERNRQMLVSGSWSFEEFKKDLTLYTDLIPEAKDLIEFSLDHKNVAFLSEEDFVDKLIDVAKGEDNESPVTPRKRTRMIDDWKLTKKQVFKGNWKSLISFLENLNTYFELPANVNEVMEPIINLAKMTNETPEDFVNRLVSISEKGNVSVTQKVAIARTWEKTMEEIRKGNWKSFNGFLVNLRNNNIKLPLEITLLLKNFNSLQQMAVRAEFKNGLFGAVAYQGKPEKIPARLGPVKKKRGISPVELVFVLAIIGTILALSFPNVRTFGLLCFETGFLAFLFILVSSGISIFGMRFFLRKPASAFLNILLSMNKKKSSTFVSNEADEIPKENGKIPKPISYKKNSLRSPLWTPFLPIHNEFFEVAKSMQLWGHGAGVFYDSTFNMLGRKSMGEKRDSMLSIIMEGQIRRPQLIGTIASIPRMLAVVKLPFVLLIMFRFLLLDLSFSGFIISLSMATVLLTLVFLLWLVGEASYFGPFGKNYIPSIYRPDIYGPYWVILSSEYHWLPREWSIQGLKEFFNHLYQRIPIYFRGIPRNHHVAYVVPDEDISFFRENIEKAVHDGTITSSEAEERLQKLISISDFINPSLNILQKQQIKQKSHSLPDRHVTSLSLQNVRIVLAEDSSDNSRQVRQILVGAGAKPENIIIINDPQEIIDTLNHIKEPHIVFLDVSYYQDEIDGYEILEELEPQSNSRVIIMNSDDSRLIFGREDEFARTFPQSSQIIGDAKRDHNLLIPESKLGVVFGKSNLMTWVDRAIKKLNVVSRSHHGSENTIDDYRFYSDLTGAQKRSRIYLRIWQHFKYFKKNLVREISSIKLEIEKSWGNLNENGVFVDGLILFRFQTPIAVYEVGMKPSEKVAWGRGLFVPEEQRGLDLGFQITDELITLLIEKGYHEFHVGNLELEGSGLLQGDEANQRLAGRILERYNHVVLENRIVRDEDQKLLSYAINLKKAAAIKKQVNIKSAEKIVNDFLTISVESEYGDSVYSPELVTVILKWKEKPTSHFYIRRIKKELMNDIAELIVNILRRETSNWTEKDWRDSKADIRLSKIVIGNVSNKIDPGTVSKGEVSDSDKRHLRYKPLEGKGLLELLVVIAIIGALLALGLPLFDSVRDLWSGWLGDLQNIWAWVIPLIGMGGMLGGVTTRNPDDENFELVYIDGIKTPLRVLKANARFWEMRYEKVNPIDIEKGKILLDRFEKVEGLLTFGLYPWLIRNLYRSEIKIKRDRQKNLENVLLTEFKSKMILGYNIYDRIFLLLHTLAGLHVSDEEPDSFTNLGEYRQFIKKAQIHLIQPMTQHEVETLKNVLIDFTAESEWLRNAITDLLSLLESDDLSQENRSGAMADQNIALLYLARRIEKEISLLQKGQPVDPNLDEKLDLVRNHIISHPDINEAWQEPLVYTKKEIRSKKTLQTVVLATVQENGKHRLDQIRNSHRFILAWLESMSFFSTNWTIVDTNSYAGALFVSMDKQYVPSSNSERLTQIEEFVNSHLSEDLTDDQREKILFSKLKIPKTESVPRLGILFFVQLQKLRQKINANVSVVDPQSSRWKKEKGKKLVIENHKYIFRDPQSYLDQENVLTIPHFLEQAHYGENQFGAVDALATITTKLADDYFNAWGTPAGTVGVPISDSLRQVLLQYGATIHGKSKLIYVSDNREEGGDNDDGDNDIEPDSKPDPSRELDPTDPHLIRTGSTLIEPLIIIAMTALAIDTVVLPFIHPTHSSFFLEFFSKPVTVLPTLFMLPVVGMAWNWPSLFGGLGPIKKTDPALIKENPTLAGKTVLLVDDHKIVRQALKLLLGTLGINNVVEAENGQEAWNILNGPEHRFDLIISDFSMPVMDGHEFYLKLQGSPSKTIPFLLHTSHDLEHIRTHTNVPDELYLNKVLSFAEKALKIKQVLGIPVDQNLNESNRSGFSNVALLFVLIIVALMLNVGVNWAWIATAVGFGVVGMAKYFPDPNHVISKDEWKNLNLSNTRWGQIRPQTLNLIFSSQYEATRKRFKGLRKQDMLGVHFREIKNPLIGKTLEGFYRYFSDLKASRGEEYVQSYPTTTFILETLGWISPRPLPHQIKSISQLQSQLRQGYLREIPWTFLSNSVQREMITRVISVKLKKPLVEVSRRDVQGLTASDIKKIKIPELNVTLDRLFRRYAKEVEIDKLARTPRWHMLETLGFLDPVNGVVDMGDLESAEDLKSLIESGAILPDRMPWDLLLEHNLPFVIHLVKLVAAQRFHLPTDKIDVHHMGFLVKADFQREIPGLGRNLYHLYKYMSRHKRNGVVFQINLLSKLGLMDKILKVESTFGLEKLWQLANLTNTGNPHFWEQLPLGTQRALIHMLSVISSRKMRTPQIIKRVRNLTSHDFKIFHIPNFGSLEGMYKHYAAKKPKRNIKTIDFIMENTGFVSKSGLLEETVNRITKNSLYLDMKYLPRAEQKLMERLLQNEAQFNISEIREIRTVIAAALDRIPQLRFEFFSPNESKQLDRWASILNDYWGLIDSAEWDADHFLKNYYSSIRRAPEMKNISFLRGLQTVATSVKWADQAIDPAFVRSTIERYWDLQGSARGNILGQKIYAMGMIYPHLIMNALQKIPRGLKSRDVSTYLNSEEGQRFLASLIHWSSLVILLFVTLKGFFGFNQFHFPRIGLMAGVGFGLLGMIVSSQEYFKNKELGIIILNYDVDFDSVFERMKKYNEQPETRVYESEDDEKFFFTALRARNISIDQRRILRDFLLGKNAKATPNNVTPETQEAYNAISRMLKQTPLTIGVNGQRTWAVFHVVDKETNVNEAIRNLKANYKDGTLKILIVPAEVDPNIYKNPDVRVIGNNLSDIAGLNTYLSEQKISLARVNLYVDRHAINDFNQSPVDLYLDRLKASQISVFEYIRWGQFLTISRNLFESLKNLPGLNTLLIRDRKVRTAA